MKRVIIRIAMAICFAIERAAATAHDWLDARLPVSAEETLDDIADYLSGTLDQSRVDQYIDEHSHRVGMPPRGRR